MEVDIREMKMDSIVITKPKKTDDSLFGKIVYNDSTLRVFFPNAQVIKHKQIKHLSNYYTVLFVKLPKSVCAAMVEFDAQCTDIVKKNISQWFTKGLDENIIEEYYTSSVVVSKSDGYLIKLKLQGVDELLEPNRYDVVMDLKGLRFYKQRFIPEWEMVGVKHIDGDFMNSLQSEDEETWQDDQDDDVPGPDDEEITAIISGMDERLEGLLQKVRQEHAEIIEQKQIAEENVSRIENIFRKWENSEKTLALVDEINIDLNA